MLWAVPPGTSVLLIDDSRDYTLLIERAFRRQSPGISVRMEHTGERAIEHLSACGTRIPVPGLVLLDRHIPDGPDGFEVLRAARTVAALAEVPIYMLSANHEEKNIDRARELGADGYIGKPTGDRHMELVNHILALRPWRREQAAGMGGEESCRGYDGTGSALTLAPRQDALQSAPTVPHSMQTAPNASFLPLPQEAHVLVRLFEHFREMTRQSFDPVDLAINDACRRHRIPPAHARGDKKDQITVRNRQAVIFELFDLGYSDQVIEDNFTMCRRQIERVRLAWREKHVGLLSDRKN